MPSIPNFATHIARIEANLDMLSTLQSWTPPSEVVTLLQDITEAYEALIMDMLTIADPEEAQALRVLIDHPARDFIALRCEACGVPLESGRLCADCAPPGREPQA
jgi:hypothetical protein